VVTIPYVAPYPGEYRELRPNLALLGRLAAENGGEMLDPENLAAGLKRLYTPSPGKASAATKAGGRWLAPRCFSSLPIW
jgi:hypothetical protein